MIVDLSSYKQIEELDFGGNGMDDIGDEDEADEAFRDVIDRQRLMPY